MSATETPPEAPSASQQSMETATTMLNEGKGKLRQLLDEMRTSAESDPNIAPMLEQFQRDLEASVQRTINEFAQLPTVARIFESWNKAGLPPDDITFLLTDVAALLDARNSQSHQDLARLIGLLAEAVLSVAHVYTLSFNEAKAARLESAGLRKEIQRLTADNKVITSRLTEMTGVLKKNIQLSYDLTTSLHAHNWKGQLLWVGMSVCSCLLGMGIMWFFSRH